jgi:cytochrome c553
VNPVSIQIKNYRSLTWALGFLAASSPWTAQALDDFLPEEKAYYLCAGCHGPETGGVLYPMPHDIPAIIGQKKEYLLKQLLAYREGRRIHPNMSDVLSNYSDQNLADLAEYYESLGPKRPVHEPKAHTPPVPVPVVTAPPAPAQPVHHHKKKPKPMNSTSSVTPKTP